MERLGPKGCQPAGLHLPRVMKPLYILHTILRVLLIQEIKLEKLLKIKLVYMFELIVRMGNSMWNQV
jgi:hypothetical protein